MGSRRVMTALAAALTVGAGAVASARPGPFGDPTGPSARQAACYFGECSDGAGPSGQKAALPPGNYANESTNFGVKPQDYLETSVGSQTPLSVPGATRITTNQLVELFDRKIEFALIDVLEGQHPRSLPRAHRLPRAGLPGNFEDRAQSELARDLSLITNRRQDYPMIFFCIGARCWESYNAVLRARALGYTNIYWYRGGISAWEDAGLPLFPRN